MSLFIKIIDVHAREILDSRGNPTVEVEVTAETETTGKKITARESVPSGASTGRFEAIELRDGEERYFGLGVRKVVDHVNQKIREKLIGFNVLDQAGIDRIMVEEDGTDNKGKSWCKCNSWCFHGVCQNRGKSIRTAVVPLSWRHDGTHSSGSDDECHQRWSACKKFH